MQVNQNSAYFFLPGQVLRCRSTKNSAYSFLPRQFLRRRSTKIVPFFSTWAILKMQHQGSSFLPWKTPGFTCLIILDWQVGSLRMSRLAHVSRRLVWTTLREPEVKMRATDSKWNPENHFTSAGILSLLLFFLTCFFPIPWSPIDPWMMGRKKYQNIPIIPYRIPKVYLVSS